MVQTLAVLRHVRGFDPIPNIVSLVLTGWSFKGPVLFSLAECGMFSSKTLVDRWAYSVPRQTSPPMCLLCLFRHEWALKTSIGRLWG